MIRATKNDDQLGGPSTRSLVAKICYVMTVEQMQKPLWQLLIISIGVLTILLKTSILGH